VIVLSVLFVQLVQLMQLVLTMLTVLTVLNPPCSRLPSSAGRRGLPLFQTASWWWPILTLLECVSSV
jgi:hypothetical protein